MVVRRKSARVKKNVGGLSAKKRREIGLRVNHLGLSLPGQVLRLDLYRLICYFQTSKYLARLSDMGDFCPWQGLRDEFQDAEIIRILLQTAVAVRFTGFGHADPLRSHREILEESVGELCKSVNVKTSEPLVLREACNKIVHAKNIVLDSNKSGNPYEHYLKPRIFCYEDFQKRTGWKATIDLLSFVERSDALVVTFS
jgi:hypothetical protein